METIKERPDGLDITSADYKEDVKLESNIKEYFRGKNVFLTGGTGFLGILLIEKLIRVCKVNKVYVLIRPKKGKDIDNRLEEIVSGPVFDKVNRLMDIKSKVQAVSGDCSEISLGLCPGDLQMVIDNTDIVIHSAATVKFDEMIRLATNINVRGTLELLKIAKKMPNLQSFNYISTAYSNCVEDVIEEKLYPPAMSFQKLINLVESSTDEMLENITQHIIGKYPNTYVFTKQVAESIVKSFSHDIPVSIVRPSIIVGTVEDPIAGWINNVYGVTGIIVGAALGLVRTVYCDPNIVIDIVPADYVINLVLAATYEIGKKNKENPKYLQEPNLEVPVYHLVSGARNPIDLNTLLKYSETVGPEFPSTKCVWNYGFSMTRSYFLYIIYTGLFHFLPAAIADSILFILRKKPMFWKIYTKIQRFSRPILYFTCNTFNLPDTRTLALFNNLSPGDRKLFNFDMVSFEWDVYFYTYFGGMRRYLLGDTPETIPQGHKHFLKLKILHYTVLTVVWSMLIWFVILPFVSAMAPIFGF